MLLLGRTRKRVMERVFEELLGFPVIVGDDGIITDEVCLFEEALAKSLEHSTENWQPNIVLVLNQFLDNKMKMRCSIIAIDPVLLWCIL